MCIYILLLLLCDCHHNSKILICGRLGQDSFQLETSFCCEVNVYNNLTCWAVSWGWPPCWWTPPPPPTAPRGDGGLPATPTAAPNRAAEPPPIAGVPPGTRLPPLPVVAIGEVTFVRTAGLNVHLKKIKLVIYSNKIYLIKLSNK